MNPSPTPRAMSCWSASSRSWATQRWWSIVTVHPSGALPSRETYLYADNISINEDQQQPVTFQLSKDMHLADAEGNELLVRIVEIVGNSALVEYRHCPPFRRAAEQGDADAQ